MVSDRVKMKQRKRKLERDERSAEANERIRECGVSMNGLLLNRATRRGNGGQR